MSEDAIAFGVLAGIGTIFFALLALWARWTRSGEDVPIAMLFRDDPQPTFRGRRISFEAPSTVLVPGGPEFMVLETRRGMLGPGQLTGDEAFDHDFFVEGERAKILATLDEALRARLARVFARGCQVRIAKGAMRIESTTGRNLLEIARDAIIVLEDLEAAARLHWPTRLCERATDDSEPGVRLSALNALRSTFRDSPEAEVARQAALTDADERVRRAAGLEEGMLALSDAPGGALSPAVETGALSTPPKK